MLVKIMNLFSITV